MMAAPADVTPAALPGRPLTVTEYARAVGYHPNHVRELCAAGKIAGACKPFGAWRIPPSAVPARLRPAAGPKTETPAERTARATAALAAAGLAPANRCDSVRAVPKRR